jgi:hypothetical protein
MATAPWPRDPRQPYPNPRRRELQRRIQQAQRNYRRAKTDLGRDNNTAWLASLMAQYAAEPAMCPADLQPGPARDDAWRLPPAAFGPDALPFLPEYPFDTPGDGQGCYFLYAGPGHLSPLYDGPPVDPYCVPLMHRYITSNTLEKIYATPQPTVMHLRWDEALSRLLAPPPPMTPVGEPIHTILIDPQGLAAGYRRTLVVGATNDIATARDAAERWAALLEIRFLVAIARFGFFNH